MYIQCWVSISVLLLGPDDHPFLRAHAGMAGLSLEDGMGHNAGQVARKTTEEEDMAYFEKRYQARVSEQLYTCGYLACVRIDFHSILTCIMEPYLSFSSYGMVLLF